jgi:hypothetical protein
MNYANIDKPLRKKAMNYASSLLVYHLVIEASQDKKYILWAILSATRFNHTT